MTYITPTISMGLEVDFSFFYRYLLFNAIHTAGGGVIGRGMGIYPN